MFVVICPLVTIFGRDNILQYLQTIPIKLQEYNSNNGIDLGNNYKHVKVLCRTTFYFAEHYTAAICGKQFGGEITRLLYNSFGFNLYKQ